MKKINIYLVANEQELIKDEKEISNFIRDLNDKYEEYNIYFKLVTDENVEEIKKAEIQNSELFFILFYKEIDNNTINKFNIAYQSFKNTKMPKISTYVKKSEEQAGQSVINFMQKLDQELGHYYNIYENIDTIKLNIILHLQALGLKVRQRKKRRWKIIYRRKRNNVIRKNTYNF